MKKVQSAAVDTGRDGWILLGISAVLLLLRGVYLQLWTPYGLAPDEAQYWHWLAHNDWSFLTKPPLTTWLMGVSTALLGHTLLGVKAFALLGQVLVPVLGFGIAKEVYGRRGAWWAFALLSSVPLVAAGGLMMSPDAILLPLWMAALWVVVRAFGEKTEAQALCRGRWVILGLLVGVAGLAKYSAALFYPLLFAFLLWQRPHWLKNPWPWVSGLVALAFQAPVVLWNARHDWVGVAHVLWQTDGGGDSRHGGLVTMAEFLGGQLAVVGIPFLLVLGAWVIGSWKSEVGNRKSGIGVRNPVAERFLWVMTVPIFAGFLLLTLHGKVQANWPLLGTVPALLLVPALLEGRWRRVLVGVAGAGVGLNFLMSLLMHDTDMVRYLGIPLKLKSDPTKDLRGWPELGGLVAVMLNKVQNPVVLASRYQTLAPMAFHTPGGWEFAYLNAEGRRANQYDLWPLPDLNGRLVVYVSERTSLPEGIRARFSRCEPYHRVAVEERGEVVRGVSMWVCW